MIQTPNKIYCVEYKGDHAKLGGTYHSHFVIVVAASSIDVARQYVKEQIGIDEVPTWLMGSAYPTIWSQDGSVPLQVQAQILYNGNHHVHLKDKEPSDYRRKLNPLVFDEVGTHAFRMTATDPVYGWFWSIVKGKMFKAFVHIKDIPPIEADSLEEVLTEIEDFRNIRLLANLQPSRGS